MKAAMSEDDKILWSLLKVLWAKFKKATTYSYNHLSSQHVQKVSICKVTPGVNGPSHSVPW